MPKKTAKAILKSRANYILSVKNNQPDLHEDIRDSFYLQLNDKFDKIHTPLATATETKFGHGRYERRTAYVDSNEEIINWCKKTKEFGAKSLALVVKKCETRGKVTVENHYYICSKVFTPQEVLNITSMEWGIEAMHWSLDNTLGEDHSTIRLKPKITVGNIVRKFALSNVVNFIKRNNIKETIRTFMKTCSFNPIILQS